jgi:DNA gyrase/topoisomerase IV subunit A
VSALDSNARVVAVVAVGAHVARRASAAAEAAKAANGNGAGEAGGQGAYLTMATANGFVKKTSVAELPGITSQAYNAINVNEDDTLIGARLTNGSDELLLVTSGGRGIRFKEDEVRPMGLAAAGVMGIKPGDHGDKVVALDVVTPKGEVFMITDAGMGKRTPVKEFPTQGRHGVGVTAAQVVAKQRLVGMVIGAPDDKLVVVTSKGGGKSLKLDAAGRRGRAARGSSIVKLKDGETVLRVVPLRDQFRLPDEPEPAAPPASGKASKHDRANGKANGKAKQLPLLASKKAAKPAPKKNGAKKKKK